ncbi:hypothetical protein Tco_0567497 [Tanacetum coccineum]
MCHIVGIEPQFKNILLNAPYVPMTVGQRKPEGQWTSDERKAANLAQRLKSLIPSVLLDDQMNSVINCETAKYKDLMNELVKDGIKLSKLKINTSFINRFPKKWLSFCQSLRNTNHVKESKLASLFGKLKYEENLINSIYEIENKKSLATATPLSTAFFSTSIVQDIQDSPDDEEDTRSNQEYLNNLEEEYQERALLANSSQQKPELRPTKDFEAKYNKVKAKLALLSSNDNEMIKVKILMALANDENVAVGKESSRNGEWVKILMKKVYTLLTMEDNDDRKTFLDYLCINLNYVKEQRNNIFVTLTQDKKARIPKTLLMSL